MKTPLISIITPSYNQGQFIEATIQSVLNQTYPNIEYIVVDGGSTDQTMDLVRKYQDKIATVIHEKDRGQSDAINKGFRLAKGELVGWINSDDILATNCVEEIVKLYLQHQADGVIFSTPSVDIIDGKGKKIDVFENRIMDKDGLVNTHYSVIQPGSFYAKKALESINYIDESLRFCMDMDLFIRLLQLGKIYYTKAAPLAYFRSWEENKTNSFILPFTKEIRKTIKKYGGSRFNRSNRQLDYLLMRVMGGRLLRLVGLKK